MKTKSLYFAALLVISAAVTAVGKDEPSTGMAVISSKGSQVVKVIYKGENAGKVKINIYDASSHIVYSESRNGAAGFILPLNFTGLEFGEYTIELIDANGAKTQTINYQPAASNNNIHVSKLNENGRFLLSVANQNSDDITVKIFDGSNNLVHTSNKQVSGAFAQLFTIKNFSGACTFEVTNSAGQRTVVRF